MQELVNAEDGGNRRYILVQLDEPPEATSEAAKEGCRSIAELSRMRIRRAAKTVTEVAVAGHHKTDVGFRALKMALLNFVWVTGHEG